MCTVAEGLCYDVDFSTYGIKGSFSYTRTLIRDGNISNNGAAGSLLETMEHASTADWQKSCNDDALLFDNPSRYASGNFCGMLAVVAFALLGLCALPFIRRQSYALWYRGHIACAGADVLRIFSAFSLRFVTLNQNLYWY